jgi:hypothetical protein
MMCLSKTITISDVTGKYDGKIKYSVEHDCPLCTYQKPKFFATMEEAEDFDDNLPMQVGENYGVCDIENEDDLEGCDIENAVAYVLVDTLIEQLPAISFYETEEEALAFAKKIQDSVSVPNLYTEYGQTALGMDIVKNY